MVLEYWHKNAVMGIREKTDSAFACVLLIFILNQPQNSHIWAIWFKLVSTLMTGDVLQCHRGTLRWIIEPRPGRLESVSFKTIVRKCCPLTFLVYFSRMYTLSTVPDRGSTTRFFISNSVASL